MPDTVALEEILATLEEGLVGPLEERSCYLDTGCGLEETLRGISAAEASRTVGGNSIAAHVGHILFGFRAFGSAIAGEKKRFDWSQSMGPLVVDETEWTALRAALPDAFAALRDTITRNASASRKSMASTMSAVAHVAYHLGAIRQKLTLLRGA
jgi:hypothetical protein